MDWASSEVLQVLTFLLPGFVTAWVYYGLTAYPKPMQFERVVQALIFTTIIQVLLLIEKAALLALGERFPAVGVWDQNVALGNSLIVAVLLGLIVSKSANFDTVHRLLRRVHVTYQNSFASEWFSGFSRHETYVVLHLDGGRRLYGWPEEWPTEPGKGHFLVAEAEWLSESGNDSIPLDMVETVMVPAETVEMVEFMEPKQS